MKKILSLLFLGIFLITLTGCNEEKKDETNNNDEEIIENEEPTVEEEITLEKGTFSLSSESGTVDVEGYVTSKKMVEDFCEGDDCNYYQYYFFNITKCENEDFLQYLKSLEGNSFAGENKIGIGCITDDVLSYYNSSDEVSQSYELSKNDTEVIKNSTIDNPIILHLERLPLTYGSGAPSCYSHITNISLK